MMTPQEAESYDLDKLGDHVGLVRRIRQVDGWFFRVLYRLFGVHVWKEETDSQFRTRIVETIYTGKGWE